ncbi:zona pellucida sperm-binding protein 3 isoform X1 [Acanthochromis polyacanthus]|uniref:zona pellucida sperm-binding protein 3 isoform X1 n=3 Tax=Acanthochromis polyacanthus TaxID=80966 RepID=UPI002234D8E4|nr:zona pellucida sperm-binding protein 3 isoform X1 [Acanthochromis polyacanthus]
MKTKWHLFVLWSVLSLGILRAAADTYEYPFARRKRVFKLGTPKSKPIDLLKIEGRKSSLRLPASTAPLPLLRSYLPSKPVTPGSMSQDANIQSDFAFLPDVSVTCSTSDLVVRVRPAFYGLGADADELKLGSSCTSNGLLRPYGDLLFTYPLTACDGVRELPRGYLVYKFELHYEPSPRRFPSRAHPIKVQIECRYPRDHHVHQLAVQPTWQTYVMRKRLKGRPTDFQIKLMDDLWSKPAKSHVYQIGQTVNVQVSAPYLPVGGKLYINSCYAAPSSDSKSSLQYAIIDNYGCMMDSRRDPGASQFISRTNKSLRLSLKAFQFTIDPDTEVSIHCKLFVTSEDPGSTHKSCTYTGNRWKALTGDDSICECCESQCVTSKRRRAMMEGSARSGPLLVSDQPYTPEEGFLPVRSSIFSKRKEETAEKHDIAELHSHEKLWESEDVVKNDDGLAEEEEQLQEEGITFGEMKEPDLNELSFRERVLDDKWSESEVRSLHEFEQDGSGHEEKDLSGSKVKERFKGKGEISDMDQMMNLSQKEGEGLHHWVQVEEMLPSEVNLQRKVEPPHSEDGVENMTYTGRGEASERMIALEDQRKNDSSLADVDDGESTWYFTWR